MAVGALNPKIDAVQNTDPIPSADNVVRSGGPGYVEAIIANGGSLSGPIAVRGAVVALRVPVAWTAADMTFQGSVDGTNYADIYDSAGATERKIASANIPIAAMKWIVLSLADWLPFGYIKIRSGTSAAAVNQGADRVIRVSLAG